jgi:hypothetical protein
MIDAIRFKKNGGTDKNRLLKEIIDTLSKHSSTVEDAMSMFDKEKETVEKMFKTLQPVLNDMFNAEGMDNGKALFLSFLLIYSGADVLGGFLEDFEEGN